MIHLNVINRLYVEQLAVDVLQLPLVSLSLSFIFFLSSSYLLLLPLVCLTLFRVIVPVDRGERRFQDSDEGEFCWREGGTVIRFSIGGKREVKVNFEILRVILCAGEEFYINFSPDPP